MDDLLHLGNRNHAAVRQLLRCLGECPDCYDAFGSERYVLTYDNHAVREVAQFAPYEFVEIITNSKTYGGGGIFNLYGTVAADSAQEDLPDAGSPDEGPDVSRDTARSMVDVAIGVEGGAEDVRLPEAGSPIDTSMPAEVGVSPDGSAVCAEGARRCAGPRATEACTHGAWVAVRSTS